MDFGVVLQTNPPSSRVVEMTKTAEDFGFYLRLDVRLPCALAGAVRHLQPDAGRHVPDDGRPDGDQSRHP